MITALPMLLTFWRLYEQDKTVDDILPGDSVSRQPSPSVSEDTLPVNRVLQLPLLDDTPKT